LMIRHGQRRISQRRAGGRTRDTLARNQRRVIEFISQSSDSLPLDCPVPLNPFRHVHPFYLAGGIVRRTGALGGVFVGQNGARLCANPLNWVKFPDRPPCKPLGGLVWGDCGRSGGVVAGETHQFKALEETPPCHGNLRRLGRARNERDS
jgi:hypothetical protein